MSNALYRKYRSKNFEELVGQEHIAKTLLRVIEKGEPSHAYLFTGPRGVGKTSAARILAHGINNLEYSSRPHLDIIEIDAASNRRIEDIRDLREKVNIAPISAPYKVYIIDEVHMLTNDSFNALLKTLEEPPEHVIFILATTELHKVPPTITSRTQRFAFLPPNSEVIKNHLKNLAQKEKIKISDDALGLLAAHADGSFRDGISLLDQMASSQENSKEINEIDVAAMLGLPANESLEKLLENILRGNTAETAKIISALKNSGASSPAIATALIDKLSRRAHQDIRLARILDDLFDVIRHSFAEAKLLSVLLNAAHAANASAVKEIKATQGITPPESAQSGSETKSAETKKVPANGARKDEINKKSRKTINLNVSQGATAVSETPTTTTDLQEVVNCWTDVLKAIPAGNAPLKGTLKKAQVSINKNKIILTFKYSLHSKKMEASRHKQTLAEALKNSLGVEHAVIECVVDKNARPTPAVKPPDKTASQIMKMMGGGEMVEYK
jgi:DNA polymerase-3 subunit gamma/tau